jgi:hypothetical protein
MHEVTATYITAAAAILSTVILGLIAFGLRAQLEALRVGFELALANAETRFFEKIDKKYVSKDELGSRLTQSKNDVIGSIRTDISTLENYATERIRALEDLLKKLQWQREAEREKVAAR